MSRRRRSWRSRLRQRPSDLVEAGADVSEAILEIVKRRVELRETARTGEYGNHCYGLLAVCSASKVNVAVVAADWYPLPVASGRFTRKHSVSAVFTAIERSPA